MGIIQVMSAIELSGVDLNLLTVLAVLFEEGSVTRAAARLGRTQSAVSHALDRLREAFGDPLFVRSGQRMVPTPRAEVLRAPVREVASRLVDLMVRAPVFDPALADRRFVIAASDYFQSVLIPPLVPRFRRAAPRAHLAVHAPKSRLIERLSGGELDFALVVALESSPAIFRQPLFEDRFVCLVDEEHPTVRWKLDLPTYLRLPHALIAPLGVATGHVDRELARRGESRTIAVLLPDFMIAPRALCGTDLVLTLPERVAKLFANERLRVLEPPIDLPRLRGHLIWHERVAKDPACQWFRSLVAEMAKELF